MPLRPFSQAQSTLEDPVRKHPALKYVLGGLAGGVLVFGGIGFGIGKATA